MDKMPPACVTNFGGNRENEGNAWRASLFRWLRPSGHWYEWDEDGRSVQRFLSFDFLRIAKREEKIDPCNAWRQKRK